MPLDLDPSYPASHAFVVKLHRSSRPVKDEWHGCLESIAHGEQHDFASAGELLLWLARMTPTSPPRANAPGPIPFFNDGADDE